jgi:hypothetical protein
MEADANRVRALDERKRISADSIFDALLQKKSTLKGLLCLRCYAGGGHDAECD